jgi:hypothetical protein
MEDLCTPETDRVVQARALLVAAAEGVKRLENAASQALCRFVALTGMMARLETLTGSPEPEAADAAALDAATVCRETKILLRYIDAHDKGTSTAAGLTTLPAKLYTGGAAPSPNGRARGRSLHLTTDPRDTPVRAERC